MKSVLKKSGRYNFFATRDLIRELQTIHISQATCRRVLTQKLSGEKISKREQCPTETLIKLKVKEKFNSNIIAVNLNYNVVTLVNNYKIYIMLIKRGTGLQ